MRSVALNTKEHILGEETVKTSWIQFLWRVTSVQVISYFVFGLIFSTAFNYSNAYTASILSTFMKPTSSPWVAAGPLLQIIRGVVFAVVLYPFKNVFLKNKQGWFLLWGLFIGLAIIGPVGPAPGSVEGMIYTKLPLTYHLYGLPEVLLQTLFFSLGLFYWYRKPGKAWNTLMLIGFVLIAAMSLAGIFLR